MSAALFFSTVFLRDDSLYRTFPAMIIQNFLAGNMIFGLFWWIGILHEYLRKEYSQMVLIKFVEKEYW